MSFASSSNQAIDQLPSWKAWFLAFRPRTLPISAVPVIVSTALANMFVEQLNYYLIISALFCSVFIQIGTNVINDALDFKKGAETCVNLDKLVDKSIYV